MIYRAHAPADPLPTDEVVSPSRFHPAYCWWRVANEHDSTVAYMPDEETARWMAAALTRRAGGLPERSEVR